MTERRGERGGRRGWFDIKSVYFFCFPKNSILQLGMVDHLKVRQNCHRIENNFFQFIHKIKKNCSVRFDCTTWKMKVVINDILINIDFHDQTSRMCSPPSSHKIFQIQIIKRFDKSDTDISDLIIESFDQDGSC